MRILVTGATGFVGNAVIKKLQAIDGYTPIAAMRKPNDMCLPEVSRISVGSLSADLDWSPAFREVDAVVHTAARVHVMEDSVLNPLAEYRKVNVEGTLSLAKQAAKHGVRRLIYISSIKVAGESSESGAPLSEISTCDLVDPYSISKMESEKGLVQISKETGLEVVIIRPPLVYGPEVKANFISLMNAIYKGVPLPLSLIKNQRSMIGINNLVDAILLCLRHPLAAGKIYMVGDKEVVSTPELVKQLSQSLGCKARLFPFPPKLIKLAGRILGKSNQVDRLLNSLVVDTSAIQNELGWNPPCSRQDELRELAEWYQKLQLQEK